jgi:C4-type Zn-finger protein
MECPICNQELLYHDYFGRIASHQDGTVLGDIYICDNEDCEGYQEHYHTRRDNPDELREGYPC